MKLKSPLVIQAEIDRISKAIDNLNEQLKHMVDEEVKHVCLLSLNELKIRKSALEWIFK